MESGGLLLTQGGGMEGKKKKKVGLPQVFPSFLPAVIDILVLKLYILEYDGSQLYKTSAAFMGTDFSRDVS